MAFDSLAYAIFRQEGSLDAAGNWVTTSVGYRNNNPGNLTYAGQPGATPLPARDPNMPGAGSNVVYARFDSLDAGVAATERQLALDASRGLTLSQRLATWATGNRASYLANVTAWLGVPADTPLSALADAGAAGAPIDTPAPALSDGWGGGVELAGVSWSPVAIGALVFGGALVLAALVD